MLGGSKEDYASMIRYGKPYKKLSSSQKKEVQSELRLWTIREA